MDISMGENHKAQFARWQHVGEHLAAERTRLAHELRYVTRQAQVLEAEVAAFLADAYGVDTRKQRAQLDTERGMIVLPDVQPATVAEPEPADEPADEPMAADE